MKTLQLKYSMVKIEARLCVDVSVTFYAFVKYAYCTLYTVKTHE